VSERSVNHEMERPDEYYSIEIKVSGPEGGILEVKLGGINADDAEAPEYMLAPIVAMYRRYICDSVDPK
jgi:hypothetical protein